MSASQDDAAAERVSLDLIRLVKLLKLVSHQAARVHPAVDAPAYPLLFTLHAHDELRISTLAELTHLDVSTTSRQVSSLTGHGLLEKLSDPDDGRAQVVRLSPTGRALLDQIQTRRTGWFHQVISDWSPGEADQFADHLERFTAGLERIAQTRDS